VVPALALIYSGVDVLGFLGSTEPRATRATFIRWADEYLAEFLKKRGIGGIDLFSARCGVLHTGQAPAANFKGQLSPAGNAGLQVSDLKAVARHFVQNHAQAHLGNLLTCLAAKT
jgi:hypothetical protein